MLISCYSFAAIAQRAEKLMPDGGSLLTLTYYGGEKWIPHYNVMGVAKAALEMSVRYLAADLGTKKIRVNAISSGPIKTLAAAGIGDFRYILGWTEHNAPLRRTVTTDEVGDAAVYLLSDMSRGVTAEILHVDAGYNIVGMKHPDAPDIDITVPKRVERRGVRPNPSCRGPSSISPATGKPTGTGSGGCRASTIFRSMRSAACRRRAAASCCAICSSATAGPRRNTIMCRARSAAPAKPWN